LLQRRTGPAHADNVTGAVISGAGHFIPDEQPAALARALIDFMRPDGLRTPGSGANIDTGI
jgi:pimeloyl-ACP methyl ester carboxylesterase